MGIDHRIRGIRFMPTLLGLFLLTGCSRTLVFVERTGINLGIFVKPNESTPLVVNFGLDRKVGSIVPATGEATQQGTNGEAVNMYAGFRAAYDPKVVGTDVQPFGGDLRIRTQFASGAAATAVAGDPAVVAKIVDVTKPLVFNASFREVTPTQNRADVKQRIDTLSGLQRVRLANLMIPNLATRPADFRALMRSMIPTAGRFGTTGKQQAAAGAFVKQWADAEPDMTGANYAQWLNEIEALGT
jgi:hypothetical protein